MLDQIQISPPAISLACSQPKVGYFCTYLQLLLHNLYSQLVIMVDYLLECCQILGKARYVMINDWRTDSFNAAQEYQCPPVFLMCKPHIQLTGLLLFAA